jgi:hypothetical protein
MPIDTSEKGLESLIEADMRAGGWQRGNPGDYHAEYALDPKSRRRSIWRMTARPAGVSSQGCRAKSRIGV